MIANIVILVFVLAMAYWWSTQGFFSSVIHLGLVIVAGSIALAIWEPLVVGVLLGAIKGFAWGVGLLLPFIVVLILLRVAADKLVPKNMKFPNLISSIGGATLGAVSGSLTAGIAVIALGFMPMDADLAGYQPYSYGARTSGSAQFVRINESDSSLWLPVDRWAADFFTRLSGGAFSSLSGASIATHQPDLAFQAAVFRLRYDEHASVIALPDDVKINDVTVRPTPVAELDPAIGLQLGQDFSQEGNQLVVIDTTWSDSGGTFDSDRTGRIPPTQIRLVTQQTQGGDISTQFHEPLAYLKNNGPEADRTFVPFNNEQISAFALSDPETIGWVFIVPSGQTPKFLFVRQLRLELPNAAATEEVEGLLAKLGKPLDIPEGAEGAEAQEAGDPVAWELSKRLPRFISRNQVPGLDYMEQGDDNTVVASGSAQAIKAGRVGSRNRVSEIFVPSHKRMVRLAIRRDVAHEELGASSGSIKAAGRVALLSPNDVEHLPNAYVLLKEDGVQKINVRSSGTFANAKELPISEMAGNEMIYMYYMVNPGTKITGYRIGALTEEIDLTAE